MAIPKLALIPSGYKAGKLYSVLPTDGAGDFTTTRASVATRVNSNGLIEEVAANVPRLDYSDGGCPSLLLEPTTLNLVPDSENFSNSSWVGGGNITVESGYLAPDGSNNACKVSGSGGALNTSIGLLQSTTRSIYARTVSGVGKISLLSYFGNSNNLFDITEEWQRFEVSTSISTGSNSFYAVDFRSLSTTLSEVIIWGANATNDQSYATSYIPTQGGVVTRVAESCSQTVPSGIIGQTEGTIFFDLNTTLKNYSVISISDGTNANRVVFYFSAVLNQIASYITKSNVNSSTMQNLIVNSYANSNYKVVIKYNSIGFYVFANGQLIGTILSDYSFPNNTLSEIKFSSPDNTNLFEGKAKNIKVYNTALTDQEAIALTSN